MSQKIIIGWVSFPKIDLARTIAKLLIQKKLAGCTKVINNIESFYEWEGKIEEDNEVYVMIKTTDKAVEGIQALLKEKHPNQIYEFIYTYVDGGNKEYLDWIRKMTNTDFFNKIDI